MSRPRESRLGPLLRDVARFQLKLLIDAGRELVFVPLSLLAAGLDLLLIRRQPPRYFATMQVLSERAEAWIESAFGAAGRQFGVEPQAVDGLLAHVEAVVRDPAQGRRKAQVLKRWLDMQVARRARGGGPAGPEPRDASPPY